MKHKDPIRQKRLRGVIVLCVLSLLTVLFLVACNGDLPFREETDPALSEGDGSRPEDTPSDDTPPVDTPATPGEGSGEPTTDDTSDGVGSTIPADPGENLTIVPGETCLPEPDTEPDTKPVVDEPPPPEGELHPGDASLYDGVLIAAVHGTGSDGTLAVLPHGFVQLYNGTDQAISLAGASLYYSDGATPYVSFAFPDDATIPAGGYYLVRAAGPQNFVATNAIMTLDAYDTTWDVCLDNNEVRLLLAPSGWYVSVKQDITTFDDACSVFVASLTYSESVYAVDDLTRNKIAVRTALEAYSGYHTVNLTRADTPTLQKWAPKTSTGESNAVVASRLSEVTFTHEAGVYTQTFNLGLSAPAGYTIYYTLDGTDPSDASNRARHRYTGEIFMSGTSSMAWGPVTEAWGRMPAVSWQVGGHVIKAYATDGTYQTGVFTNTYFVTDDLSHLGVPVMSISMPCDEIMGSGFYENYLSGGSITATRPRGTAIMEVFDPDGTRVGNSRVELAVSGNGSSGAGMKSLRVYYKGTMNQDSGLQSNLDYDIFGGRATDSQGQAITSFSRLLLRNGGNDNGHTFIRDAYMQRVSAGLNLDTMASTSALVFINGEFWGVYNLCERYSPEYVESHYGVNKDNVTILENDYQELVGNQNANAPYLVGTGMAGDEIPFNDLTRYIINGNMADSAKYQYVTERMDMDSFIDMWVARLYFNARDWPENNVKVWRNKNAADPSGMDTKWHFTLLDTDMGISFYPTGDIYCTSEVADFMKAFIESNSTCGRMMNSLLKNPDFRQRFIDRYYEVITDYYTKEHLSQTLEEIIAEREPLIQMQVDRWPSDGGSVASWNTGCANMRTFVEDRHEYALRYFLNYFNITEADINYNGSIRVSLSYRDDRLDVTVDGEAVSDGTTINIPGGETRTIQVAATVAEGFVVTSITFTPRSGDPVTVTGSEAAFVVTESGTITVKCSRTSDYLTGGRLIAGGTYLFFLSDSGDLYAWGDNTHGVLGLGYAGGNVTRPTLVMTGVADVWTTSGSDCENNNKNYATAILTIDGRLLTVGRNDKGQLGRNGTTDSAVLDEVAFDGRIVAASMGHDHLLILDDQGVMWGIGSNTYGALGETSLKGTVTQFTRVAENVSLISASRRTTVYVTTDGKMWGLGDNRWNKLSTEVGEIVSTPILLGEDIGYLDSGEHQMLAVRTDGQLYYAGWRNFETFQQGGGVNPGVVYPIMLGVKKADIYFSDLVILTETGDAYVYGLNQDNGIGDKAVTGGPPAQILSGVADVAAGYNFTAYLMEDGRILIQGSNGNGQAGNGTTGGIVTLAPTDDL